MSCEESIGEGRTRPSLAETFPLKGTAGYVSDLVLVIRHGKGESVFPAGIELVRDSEEGRALTSASFFVPDEKSLSKPSLVTTEKSGEYETRVTIPLIPIPSKPGKITLTLPKLPVSFARASGKVDQLCTTPHVIEVTDPLASIGAPEKKPDPAPRSQEEVWTVARDLTLGLLALLPLLALGYFVGKKLLPKLKQEKVLPPPPPPWELALAELQAIEREGLLEREEYREHLARVTDALRAYLGRRYGFDGLESTTRELLRELGARAPDFAFEGEIRTTLHRADLVKFARKPPELEECKDAIGLSYRIVERTIPPKTLDPRTKSGRKAGS